MAKDSQLSATVSATTLDLLEQHIRATGSSKDDVVDQALRHHLQALHELPADMIVQPSIVLTRQSGEAVLREVTSGKANDALRKLMRDGD